MADSGFPFLAFRFWLSVFGFPFLAFRFWLPVFGFPFLASRFWLPVFGFLNPATCDTLPGMNDFDPRALDALYVAEARRREGELSPSPPAGRGRKAHREALEKMHKVMPKRQKGRIPLKRRRGVSIPLKKGSESPEVGKGRPSDKSPLSLIVSLSDELI